MARNACRVGKEQSGGDGGTALSAQKSTVRARRNKSRRLTWENAQAGKRNEPHRWGQHMRTSQHSEKEAPRPRSMPRTQMPSPEFSASRCAARSQFSDSVDISRPVFGTPSMKPGRPGEAALGASTGEGLPLNVRPNARGDSAAAARGAARHAGWITADALAYPARPRLHPWAPCHRALHNPAPQPNPTRPGPSAMPPHPRWGWAGRPSHQRASGRR